MTVMTAPNGLLRIATANLQRGGHVTVTGGPDRRVGGLRNTLRDVDAHVLALQECSDWGRFQHRQLRTERALRMRGFLAPSPSGGHTCTAIAPHDWLWADRFETHYASQTFHGFGLLMVKVRVMIGDTPKVVALAIINCHLDPSHWRAALPEIGLILSRLRRYAQPADDEDDPADLFGGIVLGDINYLPVGDPEIDWHAPHIQPHNRVARTRRNADGELVNDTSVAEALATADLTDVFGHFADLTGDPSYRAPTGNMARVDQFWVTKELATALKAARIIELRRTTPRLSDHDGLVVELDLTKIGVTADREYR